MSELTFEQMLEESLKTIHTGEIVEGTVMKVRLPLHIRESLPTEEARSWKMLSTIRKYLPQRLHSF